MTNSNRNSARKKSEEIMSSSQITKLNKLPHEREETCCLTEM
jgi:hypothetical protein